MASNRDSVHCRTKLTIDKTAERRIVTLSPRRYRYSERTQESRLAATELVWPQQEYLDSYVDALRRGWSPDNLRPAARDDELAAIAADPARFLARQVDRTGAAGPVTLPDGSTVARIPGFHKWMWDGEFCGSIGLRWQPGTNDLPSYVLGHIGFSVVPWKRRRGYATLALASMLAEARKEGLDYVELTTDETNIASQRVIVSNGGRLVERFDKPPHYGGAPSLRFRILLD